MVSFFKFKLRENNLFKLVISITVNYFKTSSLQHYYVQPTTCKVPQLTCDVNVRN